MPDSWILYRLKVDLNDWHARAKHGYSWGSAVDLFDKLGAFAALSDRSDPNHALPLSTSINRLRSADFAEASVSNSVRQTGEAL
jgi:hypothetical protein